MTISGTSFQLGLDAKGAFLARDAVLHINPSSEFSAGLQFADSMLLDLTKPGGGFLGVGKLSPSCALDVAGGARVARGLPTDNASNVGYSFAADGDTGLFLSDVSGSLSLLTNGKKRFSVPDLLEEAVSVTGGIVVQGNLTMTDGSLYFSMVPGPLVQLNQNEDILEFDPGEALSGGVLFGRSARFLPGYENDCVYQFDFCVCCVC